MCCKEKGIRKGLNLVVNQLNISHVSQGTAQVCVGFLFDYGTQSAQLCRWFLSCHY